MFPDPKQLVVCNFKHGGHCEVSVDKNQAYIRPVTRNLRHNRGKVCVSRTLYIQMSTKARKEDICYTEASYVYPGKPRVAGYYV